MLRFLRNKLLSAFMILGALTSVAQAKEYYSVNNPSPMDNWRGKVKYSFKKLYPNLPPEKLRALEEAEPPTIAAMFREKAELERIISFEFAARYQEAAEHFMRTRDDTELQKIYKERDEIMAQKEKAWADGTFDKLAEAKRWAEYLQKREREQKLVLYPIKVGEPPFPIDMSILNTEKTPENTQTNAAQTVSDDSWLFVGRNIFDETPFDFQAPTPQPKHDWLTDISVPDWFVAKSPFDAVPSHKQETINPDQEETNKDLTNLLDSIPNSTKPHKQQDLEDLLGALAEMEDTPSSETNMTSSAVETKEALASEIPADKIDQETLKKDLDNILDSNHTFAPLPEQQDVLDLLNDLAGEDTPKSTETTSEVALVPTPENVDTNQTPAIVEKVEQPIQEDTNNIQAISVDARKQLLKRIDNLKKGNYSEESEDPLKEDSKWPYWLLCFGSLAVLGVYVATRTKRRVSEDITTDIVQELIRHPQPQEAKDPIPGPSPVRQPLFAQDAPKDTATQSQAPEAKDPIPGPQPVRQPLFKQNAPENSATQPSEPLPAVKLDPIRHKDHMTSDDRELLAERLHAVRLMEDIRRERAKLTRQMAKAKANNDLDQIDIITTHRKALATLRKEAFAMAAGSEFRSIKEERRLLTKKMTSARRKKDVQAMTDIRQQRAELTLHEKALKSVVRDFKYKKQRTEFLKPSLVTKMKPTVSTSKAAQHARA